MDNLKNQSKDIYCLNVRSALLPDYLLKKIPDPGQTKFCAYIDKDYKLLKVDIIIAIADTSLETIVIEMFSSNRLSESDRSINWYPLETKHHYLELLDHTGKRCNVDSVTSIEVYPVYYVWTDLKHKDSFSPDSYEPLWLVIYCGYEKIGSTYLPLLQKFYVNDENMQGIVESVSIRERW